MTKNFSFTRLWLLIKKQAAEHLRLYLLSAVALLLILSLVFIFTRYTEYPNYDEETTYVIYIFGLIIAGAIFASFSFQQLGTKEKATYFLSFPASTMEKLSAALFFNLIVFPITYSIIFYLVKSLYWPYIQTLVQDNPEMVRINYINWKEEPNGFMEAFPYFFYVFFAVQAFYILGSVYFTRFGFIKTTIAGLLLIFLFVWYFQGLVIGSFPAMNGPFSIRQFDAPGEMKVYELSAFTQDLLINLARFIWAPVFWVATYFRLKETEV